MFCPQITPKNENFYGKLWKFYENIFFNPFYYRYKRIDKIKIRSVPELPTVNFCIKKIFLKKQMVLILIFGQEDSVICNQIIMNGNKIYYFSNLCVYHYRRSSIIKHFKQISRYGYNRLLIFKLKKSFYFYIYQLFFLFYSFMFLLGYQNSYLFWS